MQRLVLNSLLLAVLVLWLMACQRSDPNPALPPVTVVITVVAPTPTLDVTLEATEVVAIATAVPTEMPTLAPTITAMPTNTSVPTAIPTEEVSPTPTEEPTTIAVSPLNTCGDTGWRNAQYWNNAPDGRGSGRASIDLLTGEVLNPSDMLVIFEDGRTLSLTEHSHFSDGGDAYFDVQLLNGLQQDCYVYVVWFSQNFHGTVRLMPYGNIDSPYVRHYDGWSGDSSAITIP